ncbi:3-dehydroquinate synthase [Hyphococcus luteus]|uniref:3-dehydroquinate synthase n=1 Tax=Hyphococcus luteus TaxID=2058213 RepID=A0A2S7K915_9PROT|nr:3-dehydroquinate synthase [Marinicaulis flavus]
METVRVPLGDRSYDIKIGGGLLDQAGALISPLLKRPRVAVVTDAHVMAAQGERLRQGLQAGCVEADFITLKPGEATKSFSELEALTGRLLDLGIERDDMVLAFGGGVIGDLTGFACAILRRGCRFAQIPTTLLAQVDSAVGGKTAINVPQGKNLIGAFYQPALVLADIDALATLPARELSAGYAEVVKYGLIADAAFFEWCEKHGSALLDGDAGARTQAVKVSCEAKAAIVGADEQEKGKRALLNLGHTFGHAFEAYFGYSDKLLHGEGVALGMALAFDYSARLGLCSGQDAGRVKAHLAATGLPADIADLKAGIPADALARYMMQDKKVEQGKLTLILARAIGDAFIAKDAKVEDVAAFLKEKTGR